ncbi:prepilin-type N-terminal cleavage/methylation domain-containing protein [Enterococcus hirae]|uniref:prepilin-type N-terminal cleavage/methylation domain-containing protein n=1 Tax=Enterococcus hirae TaxID=1354 RepID=UPI0023B13597|nr:prepilin-type N-terminal cleavage/methylation domain-containing protein [Enterococcus hirae]
MRLPKYQNKAAFTLIECLISLAILSAVLLSISLLITQTTKVEQYLQQKDQKEWLIFLAQFEEEIKKEKMSSLKITVFIMRWKRKPIYLNNIMR